MSQYLDIFNKQVACVGEEKFIVALIKTTQQYLCDKYFQEDTPVDPFFDKLNTLVKHLFDRCGVSSLEELEQKILLLGLEKKMGAILPYFSWCKDMPEDFPLPPDYMEVFEAAKKIEVQLYIKYTLTLRYEEIEHAEYILDAVVSQILELEKILDMHLCHSDEENNQIKSKVSYWMGILANKSSRLLLLTGALDGLKASIEAVFPNHSITAFNGYESALVKFKSIFLAQIKFLENKQFFEGFYERENLVDKYDYVVRFFHDLEQNKDIHPESYKVVLGTLIDQIIELEHKAILDKFKHQVDHLRYKNTIGWMQRFYQLAGFANRPLVNILVALEQKKASPPSRTYHPLKLSHGQVSPSLSGRSLGITRKGSSSDLSLRPSVPTRDRSVSPNPRGKMLNVPTGQSISPDLNRRMLDANNAPPASQEILLRLSESMQKMKLGGITPTR